MNNNGDVVGYYTTCDVCSHTHGFVIKDGAATQIDYPDSQITSTRLYGGNDSDFIVGVGSSDDGVDIPFVLDLQSQTFKQLKVDVARGISNGGLIAVQYDGAPYIYCLTKTNCPASAGAISVNDKWIPAKPSSVHAVCAHACRKPIDPRS